MYFNIVICRYTTHVRDVQYSSTEMREPDYGSRMAIGPRVEGGSEVAREYL